MIHTYRVSGMTCNRCQAKVQGLLSKVTGVKNVTIDLSKGEAVVDMDKHIAINDLQEALRDYPEYQLSGALHHQPIVTPIFTEEETKSWLTIYKPLLLIFGYMTGITLLAEYTNGAFVWMRWMNHSMAVFFLVFSFFKLLNLKGFAESYSIYDIVAKKWNGWGYLFPFVELVLGIAFLTGFNPLLTNMITFVIMAVSIVGVLQSIFNKHKINCACLGTVFILPMSTTTLIEDLLMICMSGIMLLNML